MIRELYFLPLTREGGHKCEDGADNQADAQGYPNHLKGAVFGNQKKNTRQNDDGAVYINGKLFFHVGLYALRKKFHNHINVGQLYWENLYVSLYLLRDSLISATSPSSNVSQFQGLFFILFAKSYV